jgi:hypothetical protein
MFSPIEPLTDLRFSQISCRKDWHSEAKRALLWREMTPGLAPQRNMADGASGGATLMSHHFGGSHAEVIPQSEATFDPPRTR